MVEVENLVIDTIKNRLISEGLTVSISSVGERTPSTFPAVSIYEADNYSYRKTQDDVSREHHASLMYSVNVYSNKKSGAKQEAKQIFAIVDDELQSFKFTRTSMFPDANQDKSIYRIVARYEAVVAQGQEIGGDTIYQVYRK